MMSKKRNVAATTKGRGTCIGWICHDLKRAYPNYFADTDDFEKNIRQVYKANKSIQPTASATAD